MLEFLVDDYRYSIDVYQFFDKNSTVLNTELKRNKSEMLEMMVDIFEAQKEKDG